jgi:pilus assembly protein Flp/PilA
VVADGTTLATILTWQVPGTDRRKNKESKGVGTMGRISAFINDESGATAIEYGLLAALISIAALAAMKVVGTKLSTTFSKVGASL